VDWQVNLLPGEQVRWQGAPAHRSPFASPAELVTYCVAVAVTAVAGVLTVASSNEDTRHGASVGGLVGVLVVGVWSLRLLAIWAGLRRLRYVVTDSRLLVLRRHVVATWWLANLNPPVIHARRDGCGDITFGHGRTGGRMAVLSAAVATSPTAMLIRVVDPVAVRDLIATRR
jgi:hypothetical protein